MADVAVVVEGGAAADAPFIKELIQVWRAQDSHGAWEGKAATLAIPASSISRLNERTNH